VMGVMGILSATRASPAAHDDASPRLDCGQSKPLYDVVGFHAWMTAGFFAKTGGIEVNRLVAKIHPAEIIPRRPTPTGFFTRR